jgi:hypothetical protein
MAGHTSRQYARKQEADSRDRPQKEERDYITEEHVRHVRNQRPVSSHLLSISINSVSNMRLKKKNTSDALGNASGSERIRENIGIACSSSTVGILV